MSDDPSQPSEPGNPENLGSVQQELLQQPHLLMRLAENSLLVAESLRDNYFQNTAHFIAEARTFVHESVDFDESEDDQIIMKLHDVRGAKWSDWQDEVVTFIDGGIGRAPIAAQAPLLLRVGSYCVRVGERDLARREEFTYYPVILGDLEGGSKHRPDFPDIVRITAELLGGLAALQRTSNLDVLLFHGPLVYLVPSYSGHTPFTENDIDLFLRQYAPDMALGEALKNEFLEEARLDVYPLMTQRCDEWVNRRLFEPLAWMAFLYRRLIKEAQKREPIPLIAGVVERGALSGFSKGVLLPRLFRVLRVHHQPDALNTIFGRSDLTSAEAFLGKLGYDDALLLSMLLHPGEASESWVIDKYSNFRHANVTLPNEAAPNPVDFTTLKPGRLGFPKVRGFYIHLSETALPIRVEIFDELGGQVEAAARRIYLYSRLLPGYGFPVGLDIADKFAKVPSWMTNAYAKLIRYHLGISLQRGEITDAEVRRILIQSIYMTQRDWLFRPTS